MKLLAIETSTMVGSIALISDHHLLAEYQMGIKTTYSDALLPLIDYVLQGAQISIQEIDGFALALGPGSFTALRIGLSVIKGLALASKKPLVGIPSLDGLAHNICSSNVLICPVLYARKSEVYTAFYRRKDSHALKKLTPDRIVDPKKLLDEIQEEVIFLGDGSDFYRDIIPCRLEKKVFFAPLHLKYPKASVIAQLALNKFKNNEVMGIERITPVYVRPPEAEIKSRGRR
jgi:tRNA threonylcarbamoyladenosine biosynthesis protein TsaB